MTPFEKEVEQEILHCEKIKGVMVPRTEWMFLFMAIVAVVDEETK